MRVIKSRRMRLGRVCSMYDKDQKCEQNLSYNLKGRDHLGDFHVGGRTTLKYILKK
jgi:hypothetical protein